MEVLCICSGLRTHIFREFAGLRVDRGSTAHAWYFGMADRVVDANRLPSDLGYLGAGRQRGGGNVPGAPVLPARWRRVDCSDAMIA